MQSILGKDDHDHRHDHRHDARFGVLFTSTGDHDNALIDSVISQTDAESADWNPQSVADSTSGIFIRRIQESMKTPTYSELHFGQVYVVLPNSAKASAGASQPLLAQNDAVERAALPSADSEKTSALPNELAAARIAPSAEKTPVLVVFEFIEKSAEHI